MDRMLINEIFTHRVQVARAAKQTPEQVESVHWDHRYELDMLNEEEELLRSNSVLAKARKLDLPTPPRPFEDDDNEDWQGGQYFYKQTLSQTGRAKLREAIRHETKARHESWGRWLAWLTPLIAIGGIVATLLTRK
ncbi:hypothetical protein [Duganella sp. BuS-21]|uniref:hypothetical protein n=1 Tax=Duganella sp. BuS-21 TaxID=2943848 RepID=UPI0035A667A0